MKQNKFGVLKKCASLFLALLIVFAAAGTGLNTVANAATCNCAYTPIVYVWGAQSIWYEDETGARYTPVDSDDPVSTFSDALNDLLPLFSKAITTDDWDPYCDAVVKLFEDTYLPVAPNPDGTLPENTGYGNELPRDLASIPAAHGYDSLHTYVFTDDIRRSPLDIADDLNAYIENVKTKTGHDQVCLVSRCAGCNIVAAYLYKYQKDVHFAGVEKCVFMQTAMNGLDHVEAIFSGNVKLMPEAAFRFLKTNEEFKSEEAGELTETLGVMLNFLEATMGMDAACALMQRIYGKISYKLFGRIVKMYHARCLTTVSSIADHYEEFKDFIFCEEGDRERFANIIAKADDYHYNVQPAINPMLEEMQALGKPVAVIADYGDQHAPVFEESDYVSDTFASLYNQTFGATGAKVDGVLDDAYISAREAEGKGAYISPDKQVDASTCLFPETTWIVKNLHHSFPWSVDQLMLEFLRTDGFTVNSDPAYPQFLNFTFDERIVPAQEKNPEDTDWAAMKEEAQETGIPGFIEKVTSWIQTIINKFKDFLYIILGPLGLMTKDWE